MVLVDRLPQPGTHHVRVDLCRSNVGVSQHGLHAAQVRSTLQEMSRKRMPQHVRTEALENASGFPMSTKQLPKALPCDPGSAGRHEKIRAHSPLQKLGSLFRAVALK